MENRLKDYFRILHTIKGTAACLGLKNISKYVHKYEDFVGEIRDGARSLGADVNALLLKAYDMLKDIFNHIKHMVLIVISTQIFFWTNFNFKGERVLDDIDKLVFSK